MTRQHIPRADEPPRSFPTGILFGMLNTFIIVIVVKLIDAALG